MSDLDIRKQVYDLLDIALTALHNAHRLLPAGPGMESVRVAEQAVAEADKVMRRKLKKVSGRRCDFRDCRKPATHVMGRYVLCAGHAKPALHPRDLAPLIAKMPKKVPA